jgi:hypothetical protein
MTTMRTLLATALLALSLTACSDDSDATGPSTVEGLEARATVGQLEEGGAFFTVQVTLRNLTGSAITRTLSLACLVVIQLRSINGDQLVYDESARDCGELTQTVSVRPGESLTLTSGPRSIFTISQTVQAGATFNVRALVRFEGAPAPVEAGRWRLPVCRTVGIGTVCD